MFVLNKLSESESESDHQVIIIHFNKYWFVNNNIVKHVYIYIETKDDAYLNKFMRTAKS